jgi:hypothetical protein
MAQRQRSSFALTLIVTVTVGFMRAPYRTLRSAAFEQLPH